VVTPFAAELVDDRGSEGVGVRGRVVEAPPGAEAAEPVVDVKTLLEVMGERQVEERLARARQLHAGGEAACTMPRSQHARWRGRSGT
jgi:hypothetical protein